jgi:hypothetical protein
MQRDTERANAHLALQQAALTWGSYWVRFSSDAPPVFGYVPTLAEVEAAEVRAMPTPSDPEHAREQGIEVEYTMEQVRESHERGFLYGRAYSTWCPDGEHGSTHRSSAWPISESLFDAARESGWLIKDLPPEARQEIREALLGYYEHQTDKGRAIEKEEQDR